MTAPADSPPRNETPNERLSSLTAAMLRISASLDLETVFREVAESACTLTGARYGAIVTIDEKGEPQDFVTSGLTDDAHRALVEWSDGLRLFEHFRDLPGPLRLSDVPAYVRSLGFASDRLPSRTFQSTPIRHRGVHVGNFYLVEKEGGEEFTSEDEEVLVLFASQAASAIANARAYRDEQRAPTETNSARAPISRRWSRPRRSGSWCSMRGPAVWCRSIARRSASWRACACRGAPPRSC